MAFFLKSLSIILATATIICGEEIKKSEKRGIADFGSGFSSSKLEGSGIRISTDFGKELTLEEFQQNGYSFGNINNANFAKANINPRDIKFVDDLNLNSFDISKGLNFNAGQQLSSISQYNNIPQSGSNFGIQGTQEIQGIQGNIENKGIQINQNTNNNNQFENYGIDALRNLGINNGETSSVSYRTQNIPIPVPQPYQVIVNRPEVVPVPQSVPASVPSSFFSQAPQPYQVPTTRPYPVTYNHPASEPIYHPNPVHQKQENQVPLAQSYHGSVNVPQTDAAQLPQSHFAVNMNANYKVQNNEAPAQQEQPGYEQSQQQNSLQREINSDALSGNHQYSQTNQVSQPSLTDSHQGLHSIEQQYSSNSFQQGVQPNENHAPLSDQFSGVELFGGFQPSQYRTATSPDQAQQSEAHTASTDQGRGYQTDQASSDDFHQHVQSLVGHPSLSNRHTIVSNPSHGTQSSEVHNQIQSVASQPKDESFNLLGGLLGQQALEHVRKILLKTEPFNERHGHPVG